MKSNIFVPKIINVGYQNRKSTYTGKLAYVIYTDEKGVLRKEASWNNWRDKEIPTDTFDNIPTSGFVLNKKVGDTCSHWNFRQAYCRVYDPRGFEIEITIENLLYILENTNSIVGKGLEGDFVYGWDGKDLVLLPTCSPDYKEIQEYTNLMFSTENITAKNLVIGQTYRGKDNTLYIYLGKYDTYSSFYSFQNPVGSEGKQFWFAHFKDVEELSKVASNEILELKQYVMRRKSIPSKFFISVHETETSPYLCNFMEAIKHMPEFSPVHRNNIKICFYKLEDFIQYVNKYVTDRLEEVEKYGYFSYRNPLEFCSKPHNGKVNNYAMKLDTVYDPQNHSYIFNQYGIYKYNDSTSSYYDYNSYVAKYTNDNHPIQAFTNLNLSVEEIKQIYEMYRPCYVEVYLKNGELYKIIHRCPPEI